MEEAVVQESWERIVDLVRDGDTEQLEEYLRTLDPGDVARALNRMDDDEQLALLSLLEPETAARLIQELSDVQGAELLEILTPERAAAIVDQMDSDERVDVLAVLSPDASEAILLEMLPEEAKDARTLLEYEPDTAGGIMITEYLAFYAHQTVADVLRDMRDNAEEYADYSVQYTYVLKPRGRLVGVLPLRDLVLAPSRKTLEEIMIADPLKVRYDTTLAELEQLFDRHAFYGLPVVDDRDRLIGVVKHDDVEEALGERAERTILQVSGIVGGDEIRSMPYRTRSLRRLSFLSPNIVLNFMSASIIALHQDILAAVIGLAVFLPIISDMSGCSGNQAVGVSIRELSLGLIQPRDVGMVFKKELVVGMINGTALGALVGLSAAIYGAVALEFAVGHGYMYFGAVIGGALFLNSILAVVLGGLIPLGLRRLGMDPALASAPILTTLTDMAGFFFALGGAGLLIVQLGVV